MSAEDRERSAPADLTDSRWIGPYLVHGVLGRGGVGLICEASRDENSERVAVKTIRRDDERAYASIRREVFALKRLRHPGVVRFIEGDVFAATPWYAMERLVGPSLRDHLARSRGEQEDTAFAQGIGTFDTDEMTGEKPSVSAPPVADDDTWTQPTTPFGMASLDFALDVGRAIAETLAFVHGEGILHLDLKPDNVVIRPGGRPVLFDFGMARWATGQAGREDLAHWAAGGGTVSYMAPEQIADEAVDARTDLYALGCVLYELLTGRPPFLGPSPRQVAVQHQHAAPERPSQLAGGIPRELDELVLRLLAKSPRERPAYATDVAHALAQLGARRLFSDDLPRPSPHLYRGDYAGPRGALFGLSRRIDDLEAHAGGLALLAGRSGAGKTRTLAEAARYARHRGLLVIGDETRSALTPASTAVARPPLQLLAGVVRAAASRSRRLHDDRLDEAVRTHAKVLATYEPTLRTIPGFATLPAISPLPFIQARHRVFVAIAELLRALAGDRGVVLLLDDIQWADDLSLQALTHLATQIQAQDIAALIIGAYRSEEPSSTIDTLADLAGVYRYELRPLESTSVADLVADMLGLDTVPTELSDALTRRTAGNPYFVAEYLRMAIERGLIVRDDNRCWRIEFDDHDPARQLPPDLDGLLTARLDGLGPDLRLALQVVATIGRQTSLELWQTALVGHLDSHQVTELAEELVFRQFLELTRAGWYRFVHDRLRHLSYASCDPEIRIDLHARVAAAIERLGASTPQHIVELAQHWELAQIQHLARPYYLEAAHDALAGHALDDAQQALRGYLRCADGADDELVRVHNTLGAEVLALQGRWALAANQHRAAWALADALDDDRGRADARRGLAAVYNRIPGRTRAAEQAAREALDLYTRLGATSDQAKVRSVLAYNMWIAGDLAEVERALTANVETYVTTLQPHPLAETLTHLVTMVELPRCHFLAAREHAERARLLAQRANDHLLQAATEHASSLVAWRSGRLEPAYAHAQRAVELAHGLGDDRVESAYGAWLARIRFDQRRELASSIELHALERKFVATTDPKIAGELVIVGELYLAHDELHAAHRCFTRAVELQRDHGDTRFRWEALWGLATTARRRGGLDEADKLTEQALDLARFVDDTAAVSWCRCEQGKLALCRGESAASFVAAAREALPTDLTERARWVRAVEHLSTQESRRTQGLPLEIDARFSVECSGESSPMPLTGT